MTKSALMPVTKILFLAVLMVLISSGAIVAQDFKYLEVIVLGEDGKPMPEVEVNIRMSGFEFPMPTNAEGKISLNVPSDRNSVTLNIRQEGYEPVKMRWRRGTEVPSKHTLTIKKGKPLEGIVLDPRGNAVAGAEIFVASKGEPLTFLNGESLPISEQVPVLSDDKGKFTLPYLQARTTIVCLSQQGWAEIVKANQNDAQPFKVQLAPWAKVELKANAASPTSVNLEYIDALKNDSRTTNWVYHDVAIGERTVTWQRVLPGTLMVSREVPFKQVRGFPMVANRSHGVIVTLASGEQKKLELGAAGRKVTGKLILPADYQGEIDWETGCVALTENNLVDLAMRTAFFEYGKLLSQSNVVDPRQRIPPSSRPNYLVRYLATVQSDGTFVIDGVPPGQYEFTAVLVGKSPNEQTQRDLLSVDDLPCTIGAAEGKSDQEYELGKYVLDNAYSFEPLQE